MSVISGLLNKKSQEKIAEKNLEYSQKQAEKMTPMPLVNKKASELTPYDFSNLENPENLFQLSPTSVERPEFTQQDPFALNPEVTADIEKVRKNTVNRMNEGMPKEIKDRILRNLMENQYKTVQQGLSQQQALNRQTGIPTGSGVEQELLAKEVLAPAAQQQSQGAFDLALKDYEIKLNAEQELLNLGKYEEARELQSERENMARTAYNDTINAKVAEWDLNMIDRFNQIMSNQKSLYAGQGQVMEKNYSDYSADMANITNSYYNGIADIASTAATGLMNFGMQKSLLNTKLDYQKKLQGNLKKGSGQNNNINYNTDPYMTGDIIPNNSFIG